MLNTPWLDRLAAVGACPDEIGLVVCTHLHPDHCGWNTQLVAGRWTPTFPNARYVLSAPEVSFWERFAREPDRFPEFAYNRGVFEDSVAPVGEAGLVVLVDDGGQLPAPTMTTGQPLPLGAPFSTIARRRDISSPRPISNHRMLAGSRTLAMADTSCPGRRRVLAATK